ncbi:MAG TPA: hypothetical protein VIJ82_21930 [Streptosporangiaceae bacterium]|jgi:hypothetical protein
MLVAFGLEMSQDAELAAVVAAGRQDDGGRAEVDMLFYGAADEAAAEVSRLFGSVDNVGLFCDPMPCAGLLPVLRSGGVWLHLLEAVDVAAASYLFKAEVRGHRVRVTGHEALREAMRFAVRRPLAAAFAFERRRVEVDMSPLNAAAFALWGLSRNEADADPGVWAL